MIQPIVLKRVVLVVLALLAVPVLASADEKDVPTEPAADTEPSTAPAEEPGEARVLPPTGAPSLGLDSLLRPRGLTRPVDRKPTAFRGGKDRETWERDFAEARSEASELEKQVDDVQRQIRETAQGDWNYTPTGGAAPTDPEVLRLRAQLKRDKRSLEAATTRLRDLEVEASLANVPDQWIDPAP